MLRRLTTTTRMPAWKTRRKRTTAGGRWRRMRRKMTSRHQHPRVCGGRERTMDFAFIVLVQVLERGLVECSLLAVRSEAPPLVDRRDLQQRRRRGRLRRQAPT